MTFDEYQALAQRTSNVSTGFKKVQNGCLGLSGEVGEVCDIFKKFMFQGHEFDKKHMVEELGDVLWYCAELASGLGVSLGVVAEKNIEKLKKRYPNGFEAERSVNRGD